MISYIMIQSIFLEELMRILIVEDEVRLAEALAQIVEEQGYTADLAYDGITGLDYAESGIYDVVVLDVMLPGMNGFDVVRTMRKHKNQTPVLMLTARFATGDKVRGLDCGADDYLTKPFETEELLARIRAVSRRTGEVAVERLSYGDVSLNLSTYMLERCVKSDTAWRKVPYDKKTEEKIYPCKYAPCEHCTDYHLYCGVRSNKRKMASGKHDGHGASAFPASGASGGTG